MNSTDPNLYAKYSKSSPSRRHISDITPFKQLWNERSVERQSEPARVSD